VNTSASFEGNRFNQIKTKTTELVIVRAGPVEKSIELTIYPMQQEPEGTCD
jgi:hypothetical protein